MSAWEKGLRSGASEEENAFKRRSYALAQESSVLRDHIPNNRRGRSGAPARPQSLYDVAPRHPSAHGRPLTQIAENSSVRSLSQSPGRKSSQRGVSPSKIPKETHGKNSSGAEKFPISSPPSSFGTNENIYTHASSINQPSLHGQSVPQGHPQVTSSAQSPSKKIARGKSPSRIPKSTIESFQNAIKNVLGSRSQTDNASSASSVIADPAHRRPLSRGTSPSRIPTSNRRQESQSHEWQGSYGQQPLTRGISPYSNPTSNSAIDLTTSESQSLSSNASSFRRGTSPSIIPRSNSKKDLNTSESPSSPNRKSLPRGTSPSRIPRSNSKRDLRNRENSSASPSDRTVPRGTSPSRIPRSNSKKDLSNRGNSPASPSDRTLTRGISPSRIPRSNSKRDLSSRENMSTFPSERKLTRGISPSRIPRSNSKRDLSIRENMSTSPRDRKLIRGISPSRIPRSNSKRDLSSRENVSTSPSDRTLTRGISPSRIPRSNSKRDLHTRVSSSESPNKSSVPRGISPSRIPRSNSKRDLMSHGSPSSPTYTSPQYGASQSTTPLANREAEYSRTYTPTTNTRPAPRRTSPLKFPSSTRRQESDSPNVSPSSRPIETRGRNVQARGLTPTSKGRNESSIPESNFQRQRSMKNSRGSSPSRLPVKKREMIQPRQLSGTNNNMNNEIPRSVQFGNNDDQYAVANLFPNRPRSQYDLPSNGYAVSGSLAQRPFQETHLDDIRYEPRKKKKVQIRHHNSPRDLNKLRNFTKSENNMYVSSSSSESESSLGIIDIPSLNSSISLIDLAPSADEYTYQGQEMNNSSKQAIGKERFPNQLDEYYRGQKAHADTDQNANPFHSRIVSPTSFHPLTNTNLSVYQPNETRPPNVTNNGLNNQQHATRKRKNIGNSDQETTGPAKAPRAMHSAQKKFIENMIPISPNRNVASRSLENLDDGSPAPVSHHTASSRRSSLYTISPSISMGSLSPIMHSRRIIEYDNPTAEAVNDYPPLYTPPPPPSHSNSTFLSPARNTSLFSGSAIHPKQSPAYPSGEITGFHPVLPGTGPSADKKATVGGVSNNWQGSYPAPRDNEYPEPDVGGPQRSPYSGGKSIQGYDVKQYPSQQSFSGQIQENSGPYNENTSPVGSSSKLGLGSISPQHQPVPLPRQRLSAAHEQLPNQSQLKHLDPQQHQHLLQPEQHHQQQQQQQHHQQQPEHQYQQQYSEPSNNQQWQQQQQQPEHQHQQQYRELSNHQQPLQQLQKQPEHQYQQQNLELANPQQLQQQQQQEQPENQHQQQYPEHSNPQQFQQQQQHQQPEHQQQQQYSEHSNPQQLQKGQEHQYQHQFSEPADLKQLNKQPEHQYQHQYSVPADLKPLQRDQQQHHPHLSNHQSSNNKNQPLPKQFLSVPKPTYSNRQQQKQRTPADAVQEAATAAATATTAGVPQRDTSQPSTNTKSSRWFGRGNRPSQLDDLSAKREVNLIPSSSQAPSSTTPNIGRRDDSSIGKANDAAIIKGQATPSSSITSLVSDPNKTAAVAAESSRQPQHKRSAGVVGLTDRLLALPNSHTLGQQQPSSGRGENAAQVTKPSNTGLLAGLFSRKQTGGKQRYPEDDGRVIASPTDSVKNSDLKKACPDKGSPSVISVSDKTGRDGSGGVGDLKVYGVEGNGEGIHSFPYLKKELGISIVNPPNDALKDNNENENLLETLKFRESDQCRDLGIVNSAFETASIKSGQLTGNASVKPTELDNIPNTFHPLKVANNKEPGKTDGQYNDIKSGIHAPGNLNLANQGSRQCPTGVDPHHSPHQPLQGPLGSGARSAVDAGPQPPTQLSANAQNPADLLGGSHEIVQSWLQDSLGAQHPPVNASAALPPSGHNNVGNNGISQGFPAGGVGMQTTDIDDNAVKQQQISDLREAVKSLNSDRNLLGRDTMEDKMVNGAFEMGVPAGSVKDGRTNHTGGLVNNSYEIDITNSSLEDSQQTNAQSNKSGTDHDRKREKKESPEKVTHENGKPQEQNKLSNETSGPVDIMQMRLNCLQDKSTTDKRPKSQQNKNPKAPPKRPLVQKSVLQEAKSQPKSSKQKNGVKAASAQQDEDRRSSKDSSSSLMKKRGFFRRGRRSSGDSNDRDDYAESGITVGSEAQGHPLAGVEIRTYWTRFYILGLFSIIAMMECVIWGTWGPIMESARFAFPSWTSGTISLFNSWGPVVVILFIVPMAWLNQRYGLRMGIVLCTSLMATGTLIRCIPADETTFTVLANVGAFTNAISGCLTLSLPAMIAATWFPPSERTTATAVAGLFSQLGSAVMYLEPFVVRVPPYLGGGNEECSSYSRNYLKSQMEERALGTSEDSSDRTRYIRSLLLPPGINDKQERKLHSFLHPSPEISNQDFLVIKMRHGKNSQRLNRKLKRSAQRAPNPSYPDQGDSSDPNQRFGSNVDRTSDPSGLRDPLDPSDFSGNRAYSSENQGRQYESLNRELSSDTSTTNRNQNNKLYGSPFGERSSSPQNTDNEEETPRFRFRIPPSSDTSASGNSYDQDQSRSDVPKYNDSQSDTDTNRYRNPSGTVTFDGARWKQDPKKSHYPTTYGNSNSTDNLDDNNVDDDAGINIEPPVIDSSEMDDSGTDDSHANNRYRTNFIGQAQRGETPKNQTYGSTGAGQSGRDRLGGNPQGNRNEYRPGYNSGNRDYQGNYGDRNDQSNNSDKNSQDTNSERNNQDNYGRRYNPSYFGARGNQGSTTDDRKDQDERTGGRNFQGNPDGTRNYPANTDDGRNYQGFRNGGGPRTSSGFDGGRRTYEADEEDSSAPGLRDRSNQREGATSDYDTTPEDVHGDIMILMYIHAGIAVFLLILSIIYFPAKPKLPPSQSSAMERHDYFASIKIMVTNVQLMLLVLTYVFSVGVPIVWVAVMNFSLCCIGIRQVGC